MHTHKYVLIYNGIKLGEFFDMEKLLDKEHLIENLNEEMDANFERHVYKPNELGEWIYSGTTEPTYNN